MSDAVVVALITAASSVVVVAIPLWRSHGKRLAAITDQVANNHGTNLRDDLDIIRDLVLDVRADMSWVRRDHIDLTKRVDRLEDRETR